MRKILLLIAIIFSCGISAQKVNTTLTYSVQAPAQINKKTKVLVVLHGYGSNESDLFDIPKMYDNVLSFSLRGPLTTNNGGFCWYPIEFDRNGIKQYRFADALQSRALILSFIRQACAAYHVDTTNVYLMGFSQGAIMSYDLLLTNPQLVKGIIALSGRLLEEDAQVRTDPKRLSNARIFIGHGKSDNLIRIEESDKAAAFFKNRGVQDITFRKYEIPHSINGQELNDIRDWLARQK